MVPFKPMKTFSLLVFLFCSLASADARAECPGPYTIDSLSADLGSMGAKLRSGDEPGFAAVGLNVEKQLVCIQAPMAPVILANLYRSIGLSHYFSDDLDMARWWFRSALELDPSFEWGVGDIASDHPARDVLNQERNAAVAKKIPESGGRTLMIPDGGRILIDGRITTEALLTPNRPHLVQWIDVASNSVMKVWLIPGTALPMELLGEAVAAMEPDEPEVSGLVVERIERSRPPLKTPSLIAGGLGISAGIGLYVASFSARDKFDKATTNTELEKQQMLTNALVIGSGGAFAVGLGVGYIGLVLDSGPGFRVHGRF
jgi:hypothetical protein